MPLYKMSELAPLALAEINAIIRLATEKEKLAQSAGRETTNAKSVRRARRAMQLELRLTKQN